MTPEQERYAKAAHEINEAALAVEQIDHPGDRRVEAALEDATHALARAQALADEIAEGRRAETSEEPRQPEREPTAQYEAAQAAQVA